MVITGATGLQRVRPPKPHGNHTAAAFGVSRTESSRARIPARGQMPRWNILRSQLALFPAKEGQQVAIEVDGGELTSPEVRPAHPTARHIVKHAPRLELNKQRINIIDFNPTARRPGEERLGARTDRLCRQIPAGTPLLIARAPQMQHRVVTNQDREVRHRMRHLEPEPISIVRYGSGHVPNGSAGIVLVMPAAARPFTEATTASLAQTENARNQPPRPTLFDGGRSTFSMALDKKPG
jgi:hypothetical protein